MTIINMVGGSVGGEVDPSDLGYGLANVSAGDKLYSYYNQPVVKLTGTFPNNRTKNFYCGYCKVGNSRITRTPAIKGNRIGFVPENITTTTLVSDVDDGDGYRHSVSEISAVKPVIITGTTSSNHEEPWGPYTNYSIAGKWCFVSTRGVKRNYSTSADANGLYQLNESGDALETFEGTLTCVGGVYSFNATFPEVIFTPTTTTAAGAVTYIMPVDCVITEL